MNFTIDDLKLKLDQQIAALPEQQAAALRLKFELNKNVTPNKSNELLPPNEALDSELLANKAIKALRNPAIMQQLDGFFTLDNQENKELLPHLLDNKNDPYVKLLWAIFYGRQFIYKTY